MNDPVPTPAAMAVAATEPVPTPEPVPATRRLADAVGAMNATVLTGGSAVGGGSEGRTYVGAATDNREVTRGTLFFALPGARVDGFDFCGRAVEAGAAAVVVASGRGRPPGTDGVPVLAVADPRVALGDLAAFVRRSFSGAVVGVAGSNGKTTTKELVAAALAAAGPVARTAGNRNTDVGLPLTVLATTGQERFWVLEMAMRGPGEIADLARMARPRVGLVTNTGPEHMERLHTLDNVARANGEIFGALEPGGIAVLPAGDTRLLREAAPIATDHRITFGAADAVTADVRVIETVRAALAGQRVRFDVRHTPHVAMLPMAGLHNAINGAAALATALALDVPIAAAAAAMARTRLPPHRSALVAADGRRVLDDCYNANPASMSAALATLSTSPSPSGRAFAILGDMLEVGDSAAEAHRALGAEAARVVAGLAIVGAYADDIAAGARAGGLDPDRMHVAAEPADAARWLWAWTRPGDWILVKASRGARLERAVDALVVAAQEPNATSGAGRGNDARRASAAPR